MHVRISQKESSCVDPLFDKSSMSKHGQLCDVPLTACAQVLWKMCDHVIVDQAEHLQVCPKS